ncbi:MAG: transglycosylase domain-containing protein, partial [Bdellovibrio sp.]|nr:transglycosylase domain-containing protein [Bdellovibrio sp.]
MLLFFVSSLGFVLLYRFVPVPLTPLMLIRSLQSVGSDQFAGIHKDWVPLEEISPSMQRAVLKAEDYRFFEHSGFDYEAIQKAMKYNQT